jgi:hypothetical protein
MTSQVLAGLLLRQPFQPFTFIVGVEDIHIKSSEMVRHEPGNPIVVVTYNDGAESFIDLDRVALIMVESKGVR